MKHSEKQHLRDNELAIALGHANSWRTEHQRTVLLAVVAVVVVAAIAVGVVMWRSRTDAQARGMLASAMLTAEASVTPPATPSADGTPTLPSQQVGTYANERARAEAALPKFLAAADAYPDHDAGRTARYHAAATLVTLGRVDEAQGQYDRVIGGGNDLLARMSRLGKADAQLRAGNHAAAVATFQELANRTDAGVPKEALLLELARAQRLAGNPAEAQKTLTQIVEQHADSPSASEARLELDRLKS